MGSELYICLLFLFLMPLILCWLPQHLDTQVKCMTDNFGTSWIKPGPSSLLNIPLQMSTCVFRSIGISSLDHRSHGHMVCPWLSSLLSALEKATRKSFKEDCGMEN